MFTDDKHIQHAQDVLGRESEVWDEGAEGNEAGNRSEVTA